MGYRFLKELSIADVAFEANGKTLNELFGYCAEALSNVIIKNCKNIKPKTKREFEVNSESVETLLIEFLNKLIFYKDSENLIFREAAVEVSKEAEIWRAACSVKGDKLNTKKMEFLVDVKAATMHMLKLENVDGTWEARVVLDI